MQKQRQIFWVRSQKLKGKCNHIQLQFDRIKAINHQLTLSGEYKPPFNSTDMINFGHWVNCAHKLLSHRNLFAEICCTCLDSYPPWRRLLNALIGHKVLQLQGPSTNEAEGRTHWNWTIQMSLPEDPQTVGIIKCDTSFVTVQTHS